MRCSEPAGIPEFVPQASASHAFSRRGASPRKSCALNLGLRHGSAMSSGSVPLEALKVHGKALQRYWDLPTAAVLAFATCGNICWHLIMLAAGGSRFWG